MLIVKKLQLLGYRLSTNGGKIAYKHLGQLPPAQQVKPLFEKLKKNKSAAIAYLEQQKRRTANKRKGRGEILTHKSSFFGNQRACERCEQEENLRE